MGDKIIELYDPEFVYFDWDENLDEKMGFVCDSIHSLKEKVNMIGTKFFHRIRYGTKDYPFAYGNDISRFFYYDPDYEAKWIYYKIIPKKVKEAVESIKQDYPYYALVVQSYETEPCQNCNQFMITFTGKGNKFTYNTVQFSKSSSEDAAAMIIRDISRVLYKAHISNTLNLTEKEKGLYNLAIDLELSHIVRETLVGFQATPELFGFPNNLSAKEYYELLKERLSQEEVNDGMQK